MFVIAIVVMSAGVARAQAPGETPARERPAPVKRYGWKIAAADVVAIGLMAAGAVKMTDDDEGWGPFAIGAGVVMYVADGAIVHARRGHSGKAATSVALRVLVPVAACGLGALAGSPGNDREGPFGSILGGMAGLGIGTVTALAIDWLVLAKETHVTPVVQPTSGGATFGLAGSF